MYDSQINYSQMLQLAWLNNFFSTNDKLCIGLFMPDLMLGFGKLI